MYHYSRAVSRYSFRAPPRRNFILMTNAYRFVRTFLLAGFLSACIAQPSGCAPAPAPSFAGTVAPEIIRSFAHDTLAFTQGLFFHDSLLYESTGAPAGQVSSLRILNPRSGAILRSIELRGVFAEGIAVMSGELVQLTWRDGFAFAYPFPSLASGTQKYRYSGEGWGLASDGERWYMSNGSDTIVIRDRAFNVVRRMPVRLHAKPLRSLNELEFARGKLYANIWYSSLIAEIDPATGVVTRTIDCAALIAAAALRSQEHVLNGIAWDAKRDVFYLTGKNWAKIFEVTIRK